MNVEDTDAMKGDIAGLCEGNEGASITPFSTSPLEDTALQVNELLHRIQTKRDLLRKLRLVKNYRGREDMMNLDLNTSTWRSAATAALKDLQRHLSTEEHPVTPSDLLLRLGIDPHHLGDLHDD